MRTIRIDINNKESVDNAIEQLKAIRDEWERKANLCCETIAAMLADKISDNFSAVELSDDLFDLGAQQPVWGLPMYMVYALGNTVYVQDQEIAFIEFGAGIYHNAGRENPLSAQVSFATYPGSFGNGNGSKRYWFVAHNLISYGTPAYMPIYNAIEAIKPEIPTIIRQVFV